MSAPPTPANARWITTGICELEPGTRRLPCGVNIVVLLSMPQICEFWNRAHGRLPRGINIVVVLSMSRNKDNILSTVRHK